MSVEVNKAELEQLIKEQAQELALGEVQHPESHAVLRFEDWKEALNSEGEVVSGQREVVSKAAHDWQCQIHGHEFMVRAQPSWRARGIEFRCNECKRLDDQRYQALKKPWLRDRNKARNRELQRRRRANS